MRVATTLTTEPLAIAGTTSEIDQINAARLGRSRAPLLIAELSQVWGGTAWLYFASVLEARTRRCLGFAAHRVRHRRLLTTAIGEAAIVAAAERERPLAAATRDVPLVFSPRCRALGVDFPPRALASAAEAGIADAFAASLREALVAGEDEHGHRSVPAAERAALAWIDHYNRRPRQALPAAA